MSETENTNWFPGDRLKYMNKDGRWEYGTVVSVDMDGDKVYATLDGYPKGVKGCFRSQSPSITKVVQKGRKKSNGRQGKL